MDPVFVPHRLDKSWGRGGGDFPAMFFWLTQCRERREWGKECVHLWLYTFTCVPEKSLPWKGDSWGVLCCLFSGKLCDIYWWPGTSLFQQQLCKWKRLWRFWSDRVLTAHCVHLNPYVGGKLLLHTWGFSFLLKYSSVILVSGIQHTDSVIHI